MQKIVIILIIVIVLILGAVLFFRFLNNKLEKAVTNPEQANMANPASVYCINQGGKLDIVTEASNGGEIGICNFTDGRSCEEWDFFRTKVCKDKNSLVF